MAGGITGTLTSQQPLPPIQPLLPPSYPDSAPTALVETIPEEQHGHAHSADPGSYSSQHMVSQSQTVYDIVEQSAAPSDACRDYLSSPEEVLLMQVFVDNVGLWMDTYDPMKHVRKGRSLFSAFPR